MGADTEVETNAQGGKQSKSPFTFYLMDPRVSLGLYENYQPVEPESNKYFARTLASSVLCVTVKSPSKYK